MPRPEKVQAVADIKERIEGAQAVFLAEYAGLSVKDQQALRRELRANGAEFKVVKMTLARRAADDLEIDSLDELLLGPTGLAFADGDPAGAAKVLKDFAKTHDVFVIKGGLLGFDFISPEKVAELADIEPREVLLAKIAGAMKAPMANLAGLLAALPRNTASLLQQLLEKKEQESSATSHQPPAEEEPETADSGDTGTAEGTSTQDASDESDAEDKTEGQIVAEVEVSDSDADEETEDQADEASEDAEEE